MALSILNVLFNSDELEPYLTVWRVSCHNNDCIGYKWYIYLQEKLQLSQRSLIINFLEVRHE